jgi:hypothetical protein
LGLSGFEFGFEFEFGLEFVFERFERVWEIWTDWEWVWELQFRPNCVFKTQVWGGLTFPPTCNRTFAMPLLKFVFLDPRQHCWCVDVLTCWRLRWCVVCWCLDVFCWRVMCCDALTGWRWCVGVLMCCDALTCWCVDLLMIVLMTCVDDLCWCVGVLCTDVNVLFWSVGDVTVLMWCVDDCADLMTLRWLMCWWYCVDPI